MPDDIRKTVDRLANALQAVILLSTKLRLELGESAEDAANLETAAGHAIRAVTELQPKPPVSESNE